MAAPIDMHAGFAPEIAAPAAEPPRVPLLLVIGPPGVGKSSAAQHVARLLEEARTGFACIDRDDFGVDGLLHRDPLLDLDDLLRLRVAAGARRLVVAWRVESGPELARVRELLAWADVTVCRLRAGAAELRERISVGQPSFQSLHLQAMALEIAPRLERQVTADIVLATDDAPPAAVAARACRHWAPHAAPPARGAVA